MRYALVPAGLLVAAACPAQAQVDPSALFDESEPHVVPCNLPVQFEDRSTWAANLWTGGVIPYEVNANVNATNATRLRIAMNELETACNIRFVPRISESAYLHVQSSTGNNSFVGRQGGGQIVNLYNWSYRYIICHELMHALGMWHEQQRPDRETFVTINTANIQSGYAGNFNIRSTATVVGPFDFESVMLYDDCSFSTCCPAGSTCTCEFACATIQAQPGYTQFQNSMGNRAYLSDGDKAGLAARYGNPVDDQYESNDSLAAAAPLWSGPSADLRLLDTNDYFRTTLAAPTTLSVQASAGVWASSNVTISVLNAAGSQLASAVPTDPDADGVYTASISLAVPAGTFYLRATRTQPWGGDYTLTVSPNCDAIDFNGDGLFPDTTDIDDFLTVFSGGACGNAPNCGDIDFNNDGLYPDTSDIDALLNVFSGGAC